MEVLQVILTIIFGFICTLSVLALVFTLTMTKHIKTWTQEDFEEMEEEYNLKHGLYKSRK